MANGPLPHAVAAAGTQLPHDDLVPDIAQHLQDDGEYRVTFVPVDPQRLVDLRWAALGAGRLLGRRVRVAITRDAVRPGTTTPITVRLTCVPAPRSVDRPTPGPGIPHQRLES